MDGVTTSVAVVVVVVVVVIVRMVITWKKTSPKKAEDTGISSYWLRVRSALPWWQYLSCSVAHLSTLRDGVVPIFATPVPPYRRYSKRLPPA